jgi:hypothetical protein
VKAALIVLFVVVAVLAFGKTRSNIELTRIRAELAAAQADAETYARQLRECEARLDATPWPVR